MICPGLHCPGCSGKQSAAVLGLVVLGLAAADELSAWVADRIWWIGGTVAACFALAVAASMWLERWHDRRGREWGTARGIYSRADVILPPAVRAPVTGAEPAYPAVAPPQVVNNFFIADASEAAAIFRHALPGQAGNAITEEDRPMALLRHLARAAQDIWTCPRCGKENPLTYRFCSRCGPS